MGAHPEFWSSLNPITTRGADYAHPITASKPGFENLPASLFMIAFGTINHHDKKETYFGVAFQ